MAFIKGMFGRQWLLPIKLRSHSDSGDTYGILCECYKGPDGDIIGPSAHICYADTNGNLVQNGVFNKNIKTVHQRSVLLPSFKSAKVAYQLSSSSSSGTVTAKCNSGAGAFLGINPDYSVYAGINKWNFVGMFTSTASGDWVSDWTNVGDTSMWGNYNQWSNNTAPLGARFNLKYIAQEIYNAFGGTCQIKIYGDIFLIMKSKNSTESPFNCLGLNFLTNYYYSRVGAGGQGAYISGDQDIITPSKWTSNTGGQGHNINEYLISSPTTYAVSLHALLYTCTTSEKDNNVSEFYAWPISFADSYDSSRWPKTVCCRTMITAQRIN